MRRNQRVSMVQKADSSMGNSLFVPPPPGPSRERDADAGEVIEIRLLI